MASVNFLIVFSFVFLMMATAYGAAAGSVPDVQNTMNQITGPWPGVDLRFCQSSDLSCNVARIGDILANPLVLIGSGLYRLGAVFYLIYQVTTMLSPLTQIPYVGTIFLGFVVILGIYAFSIFRGRSSDN